MTTSKQWNLHEIAAIYEQPFNDLLYEAHRIHKENQPANSIQLAKLLSIKTGACPEDCGYCSQSGHYSTHVEKEKLMSIEQVLVKAKEAKEQGAKRFCMGAAWRCPPDKAMPQLKEMITQVKGLGLETCMTLGMLKDEQALALKEAGLDYYNHNIDTSPSHYDKVTTTRTFKDRLDTVERVRKAGIAVCCGGILGLGETREDRIEFLQTLANMEVPPESVPINRLIPVEGTPLAKSPQVEGIELVRTIATARILMPKSVIRLTAGRTEMSDELQALCYFAGANSIFIGNKLLTEANPKQDKDNLLLSKLGIKAFESL
ncbi:biotin synthase BioB [Legionella jordanis]|uniref:Biotin synthase n=1 Tax=Legionella jordanis TaxID=456 RepID=A0A0W0VBG6_9GAMM|nr:biotin synthase BioB [Legionella jordanis]KTD17245.1 biotin synthase [Legionella jordanis]RMX03359.1 biotin synthase BioB [Legionella jordanis]RMX15837.1 biotin synthase BioB [Legionella jordanis]VEH12557.1 biotin synthetase [Legionella jordanis]HAT8713368.1 biotin synthase BioB [Legionella jordanis]